jgi:hypothetical protein
MNDAYYTETGERPALAAIEVNPPEGFIGSQIIPIVPVTQTSSVLFYATVTADSAAQTNRAIGQAPGGTQIAQSNTTYTTREAVKRGSITPDEAKGMGGIDKADEVGSKWAKRQVMRALESDVAALVMKSGSSADAAIDPAKCQTQVQTALQAIRLYEGTTALVASTYNLKSLLQQLLADSAYGPAMSRLVTGTTGVQAIQGLSLNAWLSSLAIFFGVDKVLAGDDNIWNATAIAGRMTIVKLDDGADPLSHKWKPVYGKCFQFLPDGNQPWLIESIADRLTKNNHYDATLWYDAVVLNSGAAYTFDGIAQ